MKPVRHEVSDNPRAFRPEHIVPGLLWIDQGLVTRVEANVVWTNDIPDEPYGCTADVVREVHRGDVRVFATRWEPGDTFEVNGKIWVLTNVNAGGTLTFRAPGIIGIKVYHRGTWEAMIEHGIVRLIGTVEDARR